VTRRDACRSLAGLAAFGIAGLRLSLGDERPDSFRVYTDAPRLLLRPARLRLLKRERERHSLRWDQFEMLWSANAPFPELPMVQALRWQIVGDRDAGTRAVAWAVGPGDEVRQLALIADWCGDLASRDDRAQIEAKLRRAMNDTRPMTTLAEARARLFAAVVLSETRAAESEKAIQSVFDGFWTTKLIAPLRAGKTSVPGADAYTMFEIMHVVRDNLNFDLRETFPAWFSQYPLMHLLAQYPAPWPTAENEFRIPADEAIEKSGPNITKAVFSRAAELAMVAFDSNVASSQLLQGWLINDRFLMRGAMGIPYEFLWANPYQPGLSYYHAPLALHDAIGGQLFVRSSWEDDASWIGFFGGQLQKFTEGTVTQVDPLAQKEPLDLDQAVIFFGRGNNRFTTPAANADEAVNVFIVGLNAGRSYHVEVDGEEMVEEHADPGGIVYLPEVPGTVGVRLNPRAGA
jgi:hypothetical protein